MSALKHLTDWLPTKGLHVAEFLLASVFLSPITHFISTYIFDDPQFIISLAIIIGIDTVLALLYHIKAKTVSSDGFAKFFLKIIIYGCVLIVIHTATHMRGNDGDTISLLNWFDTFGYTAIYVREAISILEKAEKLRPGTMPVWLVKRLKDFDDDGNLNNSNG